MKAGQDSEYKEGDIRSGINDLLIRYCNLGRYGKFTGQWEANEPLALGGNESLLTISSIKQNDKDILPHQALTVNVNVLNTITKTKLLETLNQIRSTIEKQKSSTAGAIFCYIPFEILYKNIISRNNKFDSWSPVFTILSAVGLYYSTKILTSGMAFAALMTNPAAVFILALTALCLISTAVSCYRSYTRQVSEPNKAIELLSSAIDLCSHLPDEPLAELTQGQ